MIHILFTDVQLMDHIHELWYKVSSPRRTCNHINGVTLTLQMWFHKADLQPVWSLVKDRSSGVLTSAAQHNGQHVPISSTSEKPMHSVLQCNVHPSAQINVYVHTWINTWFYRFSPFCFCTVCLPLFCLFFRDVCGAAPLFIFLFVLRTAFKLFSTKESTQRSTKIAKKM